MTLPRITQDPKHMDGAPCIRGLRIPVATVVGMVADGMPEADILAAYPDLEPEDIHEALAYAEIEAAIAADPDAAPTLDESWFERAEIRIDDRVIRQARPSGEPEKT